MAKLIVALVGFSKIIMLMLVFGGVVAVTIIPNLILADKIIIEDNNTRSITHARIIPEYSTYGTDIRHIDDISSKFSRGMANLKEFLEWILQNVWALVLGVIGSLITKYGDESTKNNKNDEH